jgi:hypothetical protein
VVVEMRTRQDLDVMKNNMLKAYAKLLILHAGIYL